MEITFLEAIFLNCLHKLNGERTIYSLYHLFQGKKSAQTIQDAHFFGLTPFFYVFPTIERKEIAKLAEQLGAGGHISRQSDDTWQLTEQGTATLAHSLKQYPLPKYLDGLKYHHLTGVFWERLTLLVQVCSNLVYHHKEYIPVQSRQETLNWVKTFLGKRKEGRADIAKNLYSELVFCFEKEEGIDPALLVRRLTGYSRIGLTSLQAADEAGLDHHHYQLEFLNILHYLLGTVAENKSTLSILAAAASDGRQASPFTLSAEKTFLLLEKGYTPDQIASMRNLKGNTIEDHIVEIALNVKEFSISAYVSPEKEARIMEAADKIPVRRLKEIRDRVEDANYFEIRLVLARMGGR
ncbi:helix-turn-helix domain-containing protein [Mesobacillus zeae]|uniref:RQC domain-containing protein n=1 Tax=Mesobacillus zeae TaxID=1917180 RepID=A0A398BIP0_9BACI|nr:helix-turn-helix domain-containing protein [Mesobacillus zeae]RID87326.1 RQC domain-containing protein [Mesobacillus zeae]